MDRENTLVKRYQKTPKVLNFDSNTVGTDYIVGDIHGCFSLVQTRLDEINFNYEADRLFCVGDLVDRGVESHLALRWLAYPWFHTVMGNHEWMAIQYADMPGEEYLYDRNGGSWFMDLAVEDRLRVAEEFINLPMAIKVMVGNKSVGIVHADCPSTDWNGLEEALDSCYGQQHAIWNRDNIRAEVTIENIDLVYHGHTPLNYVIQKANRVYIDTAAVFPNGKLTLERIDKWL